MQVAIQISIRKSVLSQSITTDNMYHLSFEAYAKNSPRGALEWIKQQIVSSDVRVDAAPDSEENKDPFELLRKYGGEVQIFVKNSKIRRVLSFANPDEHIFSFNVPR